MEENKIFYIEENGKQIKANILTNFTVVDETYCIYTIPIENTQNNNLYCAKIINNKLVEITDEIEKNRINKIVQKLIKL